MTNGCGGDGEISKLYRWLIGKPPSWEYCCDKHDLAYEQGGPEEWRAWADGMLRDCMKSNGHPIRAYLYWLAVRLMGSSHWNYGAANNENNTESIRRDIP